MTTILNAINVCYQIQPNYLILPTTVAISIFLGYLAKHEKISFSSIIKTLLSFFIFYFLFSIDLIGSVLLLKGQLPEFELFMADPLHKNTVLNILIAMFLPCIISAYLVGAIPSGVLLSRFSNAPDPRAIGSGNIGATNVLRSGKKLIALGTLVADIFKGIVAARIFNIPLSFLNVPLFLPDAKIGLPSVCVGFFLSMSDIIVFFAILGHIFPVWLKFKGGKGVATALGIYAVLFGWLGFFILLGIWGLTALIFRYSSLASLVTMYSAIPLGIYYSQNSFIIFLIALLITFRHKDNLSRLYHGTENKISFAGNKS